MKHLFAPLKFGSIDAPNRLFMAPLTRCRAPGHTPNAMMAKYYGQRAGAGLIIAEATMVMRGNSAFAAEPAVYSQEQVSAWKSVTDEVHRHGGRIFLQLWHGGRACHPLLNGGEVPVSASAIGIVSAKFHSPAGPVAYAIPRALEDSEIPGIIQGFAAAAGNARVAGFDGVEVHGANGYLLDQFLRDSSNKRTGPYGGAVENRARLLLEVVDAVSREWEPGRVGVRISPLNSYNDMLDSDPIGTFTQVARALNSYGIAYLHVMRSDSAGVQTGDVIGPIRRAFCGTLVANMGYTPEEAESCIARGEIDAVAFGKAFIANPDYPRRVRAGGPFNDPRPELFYAGGEEGYCDYPALAFAQETTTR